MRRALLALALLLVADAIATGAAAVAGTYQVGACAAPTPLVNNSWQPFNNNPTYLETSTNCGGEDVTGGSPSTSGLAAADVLRLSSNVPAGAMAGWQFAAPAGDTVSAISLNRDLYEQGEGWVPQIVDAGGTLLSGETCSFSASNGGCEVSGEATHTGLDTTSLAIELVCEPAPFQLTVCGNGFSEHDARVELNSATVTVTDEPTTAGHLHQRLAVHRRSCARHPLGDDRRHGQQRGAIRPPLCRRCPVRPAADGVRLHAARSLPGQLEQPVEPQHHHTLQRPAPDPSGRRRRRRQPDPRQPRADHRGQHQPARPDQPAGQRETSRRLDQPARGDHLDKPRRAAG